MVENTGNTGYQLRGAPDNSGVPEFLKTGYKVAGYVDTLLQRVQGELKDADQDVYIKGLDEVLVSDPLHMQVKSQVTRFAINGSQITKSPKQEAVEVIITRAIQELQEQVPEEYQADAIAEMEKLRPKYAANLEEAARALEIELPQ